MYVTETAGARDLYFYWHGLLMPSNPVRSKHLRPSRLVQYGYRRPSCHVRYTHGMLRPSCHVPYKHSRPSRHVRSRNGRPSHHVREKRGRPSRHVHRRKRGMYVTGIEGQGRHAMRVLATVDSFAMYTKGTVGRHTMYVIGRPRLSYHGRYKHGRPLRHGHYKHGRPSRH